MRVPVLSDNLPRSGLLELTLVLRADSDVDDYRDANIFAFSAANQIGFDCGNLEQHAGWSIPVRLRRGASQPHG